MTEPNEYGVAAGYPQPNTRLIEIASHLIPGDALEVGCGNGGDTLWLAQRGWSVTAADIAATAVHRLTQLAQETHLEHRITSLRWDLNQGLPPGDFDLINAHYLHAGPGLDRPGIFRTAAHALRPGGHLVVVDHGSIAPWSWDQDPNVGFPSPREVHTNIELDPLSSQLVRSDAQQRVASGPDGRIGEVTDHILMIQRTGL
ncbi:MULTISPECIES: class I SAM-dependent methyltransferase [unclassified Brevibacterium]|uniref:class I SAM-dependent methyltransferase n=1 Tax=unclassified Brevibacterium TaxID=2614124 RepID=UPI0010927020|nr:class I SAM-dependent methyltransferase [Brevibacterium sp. S22]TGD32634.1 class I SAM-dependent methyltransferase [Brevibacterium sp. S22]